ncbi:MAG: M24 family metallopeptidase [Myxococcota bacterium]
MNQRLTLFLEMLQSHRLDGALVRSTDSYLNEYVPSEQSRRVYLTGFAGSVGDVLVVRQKGILFVDGRYAIQAKNEATDFDVRVLPLGQSIEAAWLSELANFPNTRLGIESDRMSVNLYNRLKAEAEKHGISLIELPAFGPEIAQSTAKRWQAPLACTGETTADRLKRAAPFFAANKLDAFLVVPLDEIAWLSNERSSEFPYQMVFSARALAYADHLEILQGPIFLKKKARIGLDPALTPEAVRRELEQAGAEIVFVQSPFQAMKSIKNSAELAHMRSAIARADRVVDKVQQWVCGQMASGTFLTEAMVDAQTRVEFEKSGVTGLSFKPICGGGKNGAQIHHGTPEDKEPLRLGDLFLLDVGAYYEGGYATDLTRTFLLGGPDQKASELQKKIYTAVLKGSIAGMSARFPKGTAGASLDGIVRDPIWRQGYQYNHGTGHGVGINVHENPPRISTVGTAPIEIGQVFSIEPGIYIEDFGGVRIENLCTVNEDPELSDFLKVEPLSFCPLDKRLIDESVLSAAEKQFLQYYDGRYE